MRRKRNPCSTVSARLKLLSLGWGRGAIGDHAWLVHARVCVNASDGEEKFCARLVERCPKSKMVRQPERSLVYCAHAPPWTRHTAGLTDYEIRDLNDEINRLLREKRHWENQIVALGGANYRRNVAMLDDDGREVPGTKGYKYVLRYSLLLLTNYP